MFKAKSNVLCDCIIHVEVKCMITIVQRKGRIMEGSLVRILRYTRNDIIYCFKAVCGK